jgi:alkaline phosphatase
MLENTGITMHKTLIIVLVWISFIFSQENKTGNAIFIHPDGTGLADWNALRLIKVGPDNELNWDKLTSIGLYQGHIRNRATASSNAGATVHAYGVKPDVDDFGMIDNQVPISLSGKQLSIMQEAIKKGIAVGVINSGSIEEPGTAVFLTSNFKRANYTEIAKGIIQSGAHLIFSGGEDYLIPEGVSGRHTASGKRKDNLNLIELAIKNGYTVIYTRDELLKLSPEKPEKVLGVFASRSTFNDESEEYLKDKNLPNFSTTSPTLAEATKFAIEFLSRKGQFFLVVEEEGTDNFGNRNNANGKLEALSRADDAIGVVLNFIEKNPNTTLITTSDSEAGGMEVVGYEIDELDEIKTLPERDRNGAPLDGKEGTKTKPFVSKPDKKGVSFPFAISWSGYSDVTGGIIARAHGLNAERMKGKIDNTFIYRLMYLTLFGIWLK